jgi:putative DNA methylase
VAPKPLLEWLHRNGSDQASRNTVSRAVSIYNAWAASQAVKPTQGSLFEEYD